LINLFLIADHCELVTAAFTVDMMRLVIAGSPDRRQMVAAA
jgi:hypothetical protein